MAMVSLPVRVLNRDLFLQVGGAIQIATMASSSCPRNGFVKRVSSRSEGSFSGVISRSVMPPAGSENLASDTRSSLTQLIPGS